MKSIAVTNAREKALFILDSDNLLSYVLQYSSLSINIVFFLFLSHFLFFYLGTFLESDFGLPRLQVVYKYANNKYICIFTQRFSVR